MRCEEKGRAPDVEPLVLRIERTQLRQFGHVTTLLQEFGEANPASYNPWNPLQNPDTEQVAPSHLRHNLVAS